MNDIYVLRINAKPFVKFAYDGTNLLQGKRKNRKWSVTKPGNSGI